MTKNLEKELIHIIFNINKISEITVKINWLIDFSISLKLISASNVEWQIASLQGDMHQQIRNINTKSHKAM